MEEKVESVGLYIFITLDAKNVSRPFSNVKQFYLFLLATAGLIISYRMCCKNKLYRLFFVFDFQATYNVRIVGYVIL